MSTTKTITRRIELPAAIAAERFTFKVALERLVANGTPMMHSAFIDTDGHTLCVRRCTEAQAAIYAAALG